jgi:hypothetical protein
VRAYSELIRVVSFWHKHLQILPSLSQRGTSDGHMLRRGCDLYRELQRAMSHFFLPMQFMSFRKTKIRGGKRYA